MLISLLGLLACSAPAPEDTQAWPPPEIQSFSLLCDREAEAWELEIETSGWVTGASWWIGPPSMPLETHALRSRSASPSGDYERLSLSLAQLSDPRLQENNSSTAALCPQTETAMRLSIFEPDEGELAQCWQWGGPLDWASFELTEDCETQDLSW